MLTEKQISLGDPLCGLYYPDVLRINRLKNHHPTHKDFVHTNMQTLTTGETRKGSASLSQDTADCQVNLSFCKAENAHQFFTGDIQRDTKEISYQSPTANRIDSHCLGKNVSE